MRILPCLANLTSCFTLTPALFLRTCPVINQCCLTLVNITGSTVLLFFAYCGIVLLAYEVATPACLAATWGSQVTFPHIAAHFCCSLTATDDQQGQSTFKFILGKRNPHYMLMVKSDPPWVADFSS